MSSTNVHSEQSNNKYCASAQIVPTPEKGLEIPPKNAKPGPTRYSIKSEELVLEISSVGAYELQNDGIVIDRNTGEKIGKISIQQYKDNKEIRIKRAPSKYKQKEDKGMEH